MNIVYAMAVENMDADERKEFEASLGLSLLEWRLVQVTQAREEVKRRHELAATFGELG